MQINTDSILSGDISERIEKVEEYSKIKFPNPYIDFIEKYNIGIPTTNQFVLDKHSYKVIKKDNMIYHDNRIDLISTISIRSI